MLDKIAFMETLHSVQEVARTSLTPLSKEEIKTYFKDMELTKEQEEMVYQYLLHPQEEIVSESKEELETENGAEIDYENECRVETGSSPKTEANTEEERAVSARFQMYLEEIGDIPVLTEEQEKALYERLAQGEEQAIADISTQWLKQVVEIASEYNANDVLLDDMVQEGNIGLLMGLKTLLGKKESNPQKVLEQFVREAIENYMEEESGEGEQENSILAKVSLVHEAKEILAKELGSEPSIRQLAEYTRISEEEIADIVSLAKEVKKGE